MSGPSSAENGLHPEELRVFVGLGGNLGDRLATLRSAVDRLERGAVPGARLVAASRVYETEPVGPSRERFLNGVLELRCRCSVDALLDGLLRIEAAHGRQRRDRWEARTLDLDVLVAQRPARDGWEEVRRDEEQLRVPHPHLRERDFVLVPLQDLVGEEEMIEGHSPGWWLARLGAGDRTIIRRWGQVLQAGQRGV